MKLHMLMLQSDNVLSTPRIGRLQLTKTVYAEFQIFAGILNF